MLHLAVHFHYTESSQINLHPTASEAIERRQGKRTQMPFSTFPWFPLTQLMNTSLAGDQTWLSTQSGNGWREHTDMKSSPQRISSKEIPQIQQRNLKTDNEGKNCVGNPHFYRKLHIIKISNTKHQWSIRWEDARMALLHLKQLFVNRKLIVNECSHRYPLEVNFKPNFSTLVTWEKSRTEKLMEKG